jgi:hypothetical protein
MKECDMDWNARRAAIALHRAFMTQLTIEAKLTAATEALQAAYGAGLVQGAVKQGAMLVAPSDDVARWRHMGYGREFWGGGRPVVKES